MILDEYKLLYQFQNEILQIVKEDLEHILKIQEIKKLTNTYLKNFSVHFSDNQLVSDANLELVVYERELVKYANEIVNFVLQDKQKEEDLKFLAYHDTLTGLKNKNSLQKMLKTDIRTYSLLILNVDNFSYVNTAYGCDSGDVILIEIAKKLKDICQHEDLYRINADEFAIAYKGVIDLELLINKIQQYFYENSIKADDLLFHVSFSYGGTIGKYTLFKKATVALKEAKTLGNNRYKIYYQDENVIEDCQLTSFVHWNNIIHDALINSHVVPFFQGIYNEKLQKVTAYEALVRIKHDKGFYSPYEFLETAKLSGVLPKLTRVMITKSFEVMSHYDYRFSINITEEDLEQNFLLSFLERQSKEFNIDPKRVTFEILENISSDGGKNHIAQLNTLKKAGYKIAIDDFGTQYSNFERLLDLDIDFIKLDAKYIKNIDTDKKSQDIVEAIVLFAKRNNIPSIAEFVHNEAVAQKVKELGIEYAQGYFYSEPNIKITE